MSISINLNKAKEIAHGKRREARLIEFKPLDEEITISMADSKKIADIEFQRAAVREKYAILQTEIDNSKSDANLKIILDSLIVKNK